MSGYEMGLAENIYLSLSLITGSLVFGSYGLYRGILKHKVLWIVFGGISRLALLSACIWIFLFGPYDDMETAFGISIPSSHFTYQKIIKLMCSPLHGLRGGLHNFC